VSVAAPAGLREKQGEREHDANFRSGQAHADQWGGGPRDCERRSAAMMRASALDGPGKGYWTGTLGQVWPSKDECNQCPRTSVGFPTTPRLPDFFQILTNDSDMP